MVDGSVGTWGGENQIVKPWKGFAKHCAQHFSLSDERRLQHRDSLEVNSLS